MESYMSLLYFTLALYMEHVTCEDGVCRKGSTDIECCVDYRKVDSMCLLCPKGLYGTECNKTCPEGLYGAACRSNCDCESDQTCDAVDGCVGNITEPTNTWTTDITSTPLSEEITTPGEYQRGEIPLQYFYILPVVVVLVLGMVALTTRCRNRRSRIINSDNDAGDTVTHNVQLEEVAIPGPSNQLAPVSDYAEICESATIYSDSYDTSSIYNELSFSKLKALKRMNIRVDSCYDTTQACVVNTGTVLHIENTEKSCYDTAQACAINAEAVLQTEKEGSIVADDTACGRVSTTPNDIGMKSDSADISQENDSDLTSIIP